MSLYTTAEFEVVKTMKERVCYLATNPQREESVDTERLQYQLPDGSTVEVSDEHDVQKCMEGHLCLSSVICIVGSSGMA